MCSSTRGPGDGAVLGDVADEEGRASRCVLAKAISRPAHLAHLRHGARRAAQLGQEHGLDGVDDQRRRLQLLGGGEHLLGVGLGQEVQVRACTPSRSARTCAWRSDSSPET